MAHDSKKGVSMELSQEQVKGGIVFGDWMLAPLDSRNWELCHRHVAKAVGRHKGGTDRAIVDGMKADVLAALGGDA